MDTGIWAHWTQQATDSVWQEWDNHLRWLSLAETPVNQVNMSQN